MIEEEQVVDNPDEEVTYGNDQAQETSQDAISESSTEEAQPVSGDEQPVEQPKEEEVPFHEHPRFQKLTGDNRELKTSLEEANKKLAELSGSYDALKSTLGQPQLNEQQLQEQQAVEALREKLGLNQISGLTEKLNSLEQQNQELVASQNERLINQEVDVLKDQIKSNNLGDVETVLDAVEAHIESNPLLRNMKGQPGLPTIAFNNMYAGKLGEMAVRSANGEIVKKQTKAKTSQTESTGSIDGKKARKDYSSSPGHIVDLIDTLGGEDEITL